MEYLYKTKGVCPSMIKFDINDDIITNVEFLGGGCPGNLQAVPILVDGMKVSEIEEKLGKIICGRKNSSCARELSIAVREAYEKEKQNV